jgi:hypothetical protein
MGTMAHAKVFGIGFHKTATSSLGAALTLLGYRVCGFVDVKNPSLQGRIEEITRPLIERYDAFQDNPWPLLYRSLDRAYPGSKFILTRRPTESWIASLVKHFGGTTTPMREVIYGVGDPRGNEARYVEVYEAHNRRVVDHFKGRDEALLVLSITDGEGWERLCPFLGAPPPGVEFPLMNLARDRRAHGRRRALRSWLGKLLTPTQL